MLKRFKRLLGNDGFADVAEEVRIDCESGKCRIDTSYLAKDGSVMDESGYEVADDPDRIARIARLNPWQRS